MKTMSISTFKARALRTVAQVASTRETIVITKRGKPLAEVVPYQPPAKRAIPGRLAKYVAFEGDIVSPLGKEMWESAR